MNPAGRNQVESGGEEPQLDLSIIVPVYNVEEFLCRCLDSIFSQDFPGELEVIAVDDGSEDGSPEVLREYAKRESRLLVLTHNRNQRLSVARGTGMKAARGRYIMHVDSDDWLLPGSLAALFSKMQSEDPDVIMFNYVHADAAEFKRFAQDFEAEKISGPHLDLLPHFFRSCWAKVVKRSLADDMVYFDQRLNRGEDLILGVETFLRAKTFLCLPHTYYAYFSNPGSITSTGTKQEWFVTRVQVLEALAALKERYGSREDVLDAVVNFQMQVVHKKLALFRLSAGSVLEWNEMVAVLDRLDERGVLSREIIRADNSLVFRLFSAYRYLGLRWVTSYVVNGLLLPPFGRGWQLPARGC